VVLTEEILTQTHQALFGPQVTIRLITVATQQDATAAVNKLKIAPAASLEQTFAELAASTSNDSSSGSGGLIPAFALADPNMPLPMRTAAAATPPGEVSAVFQLDNGYGLMLVKSKTQGDGSTLQARRAEVTAAARSRQERLAMERLARLIASEPGVMITDGALQWSVKSGGFELRP
jgi:parvulin-like peptidyl-prolyl isomerase